MDFKAVTAYANGTYRDTDTMGIEQARLLLQCISGSPKAFREVEELRVRGRNPANNQDQSRELTKEALTTRSMALASMAVAFQSLQARTAHTSCTCGARQCYGNATPSIAESNSWRRQHNALLLTSMCFKLPAEL